MKCSNNVLEIMERVCKPLDTDKDIYCVDNRKLIKYLQDYEVDIPSDIYERYKNEFGNGVLQYMEILSNENMNDFPGDNSYNHNGNIYRDIDFMTCETEKGTQLVAIQMHIGGDVRGNYTDFFLLEFDFDTQFYEVLDDFCFNENGYILNYNNKELYITPLVFSEDLDVYDIENQINIYTIYGFNKEEIINQLNICYLYEKENIEIAKYIVDNIDSKDINYSIDKLKRYTIKEYEPKRIKEIKKIAEKYAKTLDKKNN